ncbi:hypothetical protein [Endozoicomonas sp. 4G]|uniref:hypothetical protein n=1 Tax=Endozoicomonas sp. 4G TaxID=2872754 RepID=UPI002078AD22|nr:hypothetical protein [Endozoicomonas sp. 4G]
MTQLQHYLTQWIVPVFLIPTLSLKVEAAGQPSTEPSSLASPLTTVSCDSLSGHTTGVKQRLSQYKNLVSGRQCIVLRANPVEDLSALIQRIPENTVILLSSNKVPSAPPYPSTAPVTAKTPVEYFIGSNIVLKDGHDILGAADDDFDIVITFKSGFTDNYMITVGTTDNFRFLETRDSHVGHVTFQPTQRSTQEPIDSVIFAQCSNRRLILANNVFHLPLYGSSVTFECVKSLNAAVNNKRPGPGLQFINNTLIGEHSKNILETFIPEDGLFINLPAIRNQSKRITVTGNTFLGNMAEAGEFVLGPGTQMDIFRNTINIANAGNTRRESNAARKGGFGLIGHTDNDSERPRYHLAGNQIQVTEIAITIYAQLELAFICNRLQAVHPWRQVRPGFSLKAVDPLALVDECGKSVSSTITMPTSAPQKICQIENTWVAINDSTDTPLSGLVNLEGHFLFNSEICRVADSFPDPVTRKTYIAGKTAGKIAGKASINSGHSTSSADTTLVMAALGVITLLNLLLNVNL